MAFKKVKSALILDLDGTVRRTKSGNRFIQDSSDIELMPGIERKINQYKEKGYLILGISNQAGVAHGFKKSKDVEEEINFTCNLFKKNPFYLIEKSNIGKRNNQNFVGIPYHRLLNMIRYKCQMRGIAFHVVDESHSSKCSFLDDEEVAHHHQYMGRRVRRGLFLSKDGRLLNADINASYNIMRKANPNALPKMVETGNWEALAVEPRVIKKAKELV